MNRTDKFASFFFNTILTLSLLLFFIGHIPGNYLLDVTNHFRPFLILISVIVSLLRVKAMKLSRTVLILLLIAVLNFHMFSFPQSTKKGLSKEIKVMQINLLMSNQNYESVRNLITQENPDIISLQEYTPDWDRELHSTLNGYTLEKKIIDSPFGICVASKYAVTHSTVSYLKNRSTPYIELTLNIEGEAIKFLSIHPTPPFTPELFESRNRFFHEVVNHYRKEKSLIIAGDLNCTQWSPYYQKIENRLVLKNCHSPLSNTWPDFLPMPIFQLDHILVSEELNVTNSRVLKAIGSDHYPLTATIAIPGVKK